MDEFKGKLKENNSALPSEVQSPEPTEPVKEPKSDKVEKKSSSKVVSRKSKSSSKKSSEKKSAKVSSSSADSESSSSNIMQTITDYSMHALNLGIQHRSFFLFGICAAGIYLYGDSASI